MRVYEPFHCRTIMQRFKISKVLGSKLSWSLALAAMAVCNPGPQDEFQAVGMTTSVRASDASNPVPLVIHDDSVIAGPMDKQLYILLDLYPNRQRIESLAAGEARQTLLTTGIKYAGDYLSRKEFRRYDRVQIDFVYIKQRDEYGRPNPLYLVQHGSVVLARGAGGSIQVLDNRINFVSR